MVGVYAGCGFRRPSPTQTAALEPVWAAALARAGQGRADIDLCVQPSGDLNAYAAGGRSVAMTSGCLGPARFRSAWVGSCRGEVRGRLLRRAAMNLTKKERRALAELEHALLEEDRTFAGQFDSWTAVQPPARRVGWRACPGLVRPATDLTIRG
jgi:hypothetical protein